MKAELGGRPTRSDFSAVVASGMLGEHASQHERHCMCDRKLERANAIIFSNSIYQHYEKGK
jgi:hypothetical protein